MNTPPSPHWHLLADRSLLERIEGDAQRRLHHPTPRDIINVPSPQDNFTYRYMTVFQDGDIARMYYALVSISYVDGKMVRKPERLCYAQSNDGIHWEKPDLGIYPPAEGTTDGNIIWMEDGVDRMGISGCSVFRDDNPACKPEHRYKAICEAGPLGKKTKGMNGLFALVSPDGIHWSMLSKDLVMTGGPGLGGFDSQNLTFWDSQRKVYRLYRRETFREGPLRAFRDVLTATSTDFLNWSEPQRLRYPGAYPDQLYTNNVQPYPRSPGLFLGFPTRYVQRGWGPAFEDLPERDRREKLIRNSGAEPTEKDPTLAGGQRAGTALTDSLFMCSTDGQTFDLWGEAFHRPGLRPINNWFYADNFQAWGMLPTKSFFPGAPDELSFFYTEGARRENQTNDCRRYTLRVDGFVSAHAGRAGGRVVTRPIACRGDKLQVNFSASAAGSVRVELLDGRGHVIPGFSRNDSVELLGDDLQRTVRWRGEGKLETLVGQDVRIAFDLVDCDLYSFQFTP